jgi:hypothetical protein
VLPGTSVTPGVISLMKNILLAETAKKKLAVKGGVT